MNEFADSMQHWWKLSLWLANGSADQESKVPYTSAAAPDDLWCVTICNMAFI